MFSVVVVVVVVVVAVFVVVVGVIVIAGGSVARAYNRTSAKDWLANRTAYTGASQLVRFARKTKNIFYPG